jgi:hypothetical protein
VPISSTLVPPTPASLHHPGYTGERSAFLAPFEAFYDALNDSKQLKGWLGEQLHKSNALIAALQRQQEQMEETVHQLVDRKVAAMRVEVYDLKMRVDELENQLRSARTQGYGGGSGSGNSPQMAKEKGKTNGYAAGVPETYHFPPIDPGAALRRPAEPVKRASSPGGGSETQSVSQTGSPVPFEIGKRLSVSAMRHDPQPVTRVAQRERERERELPQTLPPHPHVNFAASASTSGGGTGGGSKGGWSPRATKMSLPSLSTRQSLNHATTASAVDRGRRASIDRGLGGHSRQGSGSGSSRTMAQPPEKRRSSRSPDADEEGRPVPPPKHLTEQRRASVGGAQHQQHHHKRGHGHGYVSASPMDTS